MHIRATQYEVHAADYCDRAGTHICITIKQRNIEKLDVFQESDPLSMSSNGLRESHPRNEKYSVWRLQPSPYGMQNIATCLGLLCL